MLIFLAGLMAGALAATLPGIRRGRRLGTALAAAQDTAEREHLASIALDRELRAECHRLDRELAAAQSQISTEARASSEKLEALRSTREDIERQLKALCHEALQASTAQLVEMASEKLGREAAQTRHGVSQLVTPIADTLRRFDSRLGEMEHDRVAGQTELRSQLRSLATAQEKLTDGTASLVGALRQPEVRGSWGEHTLKRVLEVAGMSEGIDFVCQSSIADSDGNLKRPDVVINLPGDRKVAVDAKVPMGAYLRAMAASDRGERRQLLADHARQLRGHVAALSGREYWAALPGSAEAVFMFLPSEQILNAALEADPSLLSDVEKRRVFLATPMTLLLLLRVVAFSWRQETMAANATQMWQLGRDLHARLAGLADHLDRVGRRLDSTVAAYNETVGSYESRVLSGARRFTEFGVVAPSSQLPTPRHVSKRARALKMGGTGSTEESAVREAAAEPEEEAA